MSYPKYCQSCGQKNDYKNQSCSSCSESFNKIESIKATAGTQTIRADSYTLKSPTNFTGELDENSESELLKRFDFSIFVAEFENLLESDNSVKKNHKTINGRDLFNK